MLEEAREVLDESALLTAVRAHVLYQSVNLGLVVDEAQVAEAEALARRAIELDPECAQAWSVLGWLLSSRNRIVEGVPALRRAFELDPSDSEVVAGFIFISAMADALPPEELAPMARDFLTRDPFLPLAHIGAMWIPLMSGESETALVSARQAEKLDPSPVFAFFTALCMANLGRFDEAAAHLDRPTLNVDDGMWPRLATAFREAYRGETERARALITDDIRRWAEPDFQYTWHLAQLYTLTGDLDLALEWLERAVEAGFGNHTFLAHHDRLLRPLRDTPGFDALMERAAVKRGEVREAVRSAAGS